MDPLGMDPPITENLKLLLKLRLQNAGFACPNWANHPINWHRTKPPSFPVITSNQLTQRLFYSA